MLADGHKCALKEYTFDQTEGPRIFQREAGLLNRLRHQHIVELERVHVHTRGAYLQVGVLLHVPVPPNSLTARLVRCHCT